MAVTENEVVSRITTLTSLTCSTGRETPRQLGLPEFEQYDIRQQLDLVGLVTIVDLVPADWRKPHSGSRTRMSPGLIAPGYALLDVAGINGPVGSFEAGFQIASAQRSRTSAAPCGAGFAVLRIQQPPKN